MIVEGLQNKGTAGGWNQLTKFLIEKNKWEHKFTSESMVSPKNLQLVWNNLKLEQSIFRKEYTKQPFVIDVNILNQEKTNDEKIVLLNKLKSIHLKKENEMMEMIKKIKSIIEEVLKNEKLFSSDTRKEDENESDLEESLKEEKEERKRKKEENNSFNILNNNKIMKDGFSQLVSFQNQVSFTQNLDNLLKLTTLAEKIGVNLEKYKGSLEKMMDLAFSEENMKSIEINSFKKQARFDSKDVSDSENVDDFEEI